MYLKLVTLHPDSEQSLLSENWLVSGQCLIVISHQRNTLLDTAHRSILQLPTNLKSVLGEWKAATFLFLKKIDSQLKNI